MINMNILRQIMWGQGILYAGLLVCIILEPQGLGANDGISYYGIHLRTVVPYLLGLLGAAYFCWQAGSRMEQPQLRPVQISLLFFSLLIAGIVVTPYSVDRWFDYMHTALGSALFSLQLVLSGWLIWQLKYSWWSVLLGLTELAGGILSAIYLKPTHGFLLQAQILFQLAFGALLVLGLSRLAVQSHKPTL